MLLSLLIICVNANRNEDFDDADELGESIAHDDDDDGEHFTANEVLCCFC